MRTRLIAIGALLALTLGALAAAAFGHEASRFTERYHRPTSQVYFGLSYDGKLSQLRAVAAARPWNRIEGAPRFNVHAKRQVDRQRRLCNNRGGSPASFLLRDTQLKLPSRVPAGTAVCGTGGPDSLHNFVMYVNTRTAFYKRRKNPPSNKIDLLATLTHEYGHGMGWGGGSKHFSESSGLCPSNQDRQTMCEKITPGTLAMRTLAEHDRHTWKAKYN